MQPARDTGEGLHGAVRHSYAHAQYIHSLSILCVWKECIRIPPRVLHFSAFIIAAVECEPCI